MDTGTVIDVGKHAGEIILLISAPPLLTGLAVGLVISLLQAATQIQEMTLTFIPKLIAVGGALIIAGPWMLTLMVDFIRGLYQQIPTLIG